MGPYVTVKVMMLYLKQVLLYATTVMYRRKSKVLTGTRRCSCPAKPVRFVREALTWNQPLPWDESKQLDSSTQTSK